MHHIRIFVTVAFLGLATGCGGGGSGDDSSGVAEAQKVNFLGDWSATFIPDLCMDTEHLGLATFPSNSGSTSTLGNSRIEMQTLGCPDIGGGIVGDIIFRIESAGYPAEMERPLFQELLTERTSQDGDWTIVTYQSDFVSFHRDAGDNTNSGMYELTR